MSESDTNECETCGRSDTTNFRQVREAKEAAEAKVQTLTETLLNKTIKDAGFNPETGVVKRLAKDYDAETLGFDPDAFRTYAEAEGLTATTTDEPVEPEAENQQHLRRLQSVGDQLRQESTAPTAAPTLEQQIAEAEAAGDYRKSASLKTELQRQRMKAS